jgi:hypothetical protein
MFIIVKNKLSGDYTVDKTDFKKIDTNDFNHGLNTFYIFDTEEDFLNKIDELESEDK